MTKHNDSIRWFAHLTNKDVALVVMIPFCRTLKEADRVLEVMAEEGLERGQQGLEVYVMVEIPANVILAERLSRLRRFPGGRRDRFDLPQPRQRDRGDPAGGAGGA
jgi:pyruvate,water dikinase